MLGLANLNGETRSASCSWKASLRSSQLSGAADLLMVAERSQTLWLCIVCVLTYPFTAEGRKHMIIPWACLLSCFSCVWLLATPWTTASQVPLSRGSPGMNTRAGCYTLLQGNFLTQGSNPHPLCLLHWQAGSLPPAPTGKLIIVYQLLNASTQKMWPISTHILLAKDCCMVIGNSREAGQCHPPVESEGEKDCK